MEAFGCEFSTVFLYICGISILIYVYGKWRNSVFRNTGIPGPPPDLYIGNMRLIAKHGFNESVNRKVYGDVYGMYLGSLPMVTVYDVDIVKEVLVKNFHNFADRMVVDLNPNPFGKALFFSKGLDWYRLRNILSPTFTGGKIRHMCQYINATSTTLTTNLMKAAESKKVIEVKKYFGGYTLDTIASTSFSINMDSQQDPNHLFVTKAQKIFDANVLDNPLALIATVFPSLAPVLRLLGVYAFPVDAIEFFVKTISQMIEERKQLPVQEQNNNKNFLHLLMNVEDTSMENRHGGDNSGMNDKKHMSKDEILAQALSFLAAGYETTATTLQFISYSLATNPEVQEKLINEIDSVIGDDEPTYDNIQTLEYLDVVLHEAMRLYPSVPSVTRETAETVTIKGYTFPKGCYINVPILQINRDPLLFQDPEKFNPERWIGKARNPVSWLSFGDGPRKCIGMRLALVEMKIALIHFLRRVKFVSLPDTPDKIEFGTGITLDAKTPIKLIVELR